VGGSLRIDEGVKAEDVEIGGAFEAKGEVTAQSIEVGGTLTIGSRADIKSLEVGGTARVAGGRIREIDVGALSNRSALWNLKK
jgi:cytoskeletal protein CcmA (bactofilin family)